MDEALRKEIIKNEILRKNNGKKTIPAQYRMKYPESAEREYKRLANEYMAIEKRVLLSYIPELKQILNEGTEYHADSKKDNTSKRRTARFTGIDNTILRLKMFFDKVKKELDSALGLYDLKSRLNKIAAIGHKLSVSEWKKLVRKTLGINVLDDYYSGDSYKELLEQWVSENVDLITTIPHDSLGRMKEIVYDNYMKGATTTDIVTAIQREYGTTKRHATMIARDQTAKLNGRITQKQHRDAGVTRYKWSTSGDERVRECHGSFDGKIYSYDSPPEIWYSTKKGIVYTGRHCNPMEDYQCRCCAIPVFDIDETDLPT